VTGTDLVQPRHLHGGAAVQQGRRCGGLVGADAGGDEEVLDSAVGQRTRGGTRLRLPEVGQLEPGSGGVQGAGDVAVRLAVTHQQQTDRAGTRLGAHTREGSEPRHARAGRQEPFGRPVELRASATVAASLTTTDVSQRRAPGRYSSARAAESTSVGAAPARVAVTVVGSAPSKA